MTSHRNLSRRSAVRGATAVAAFAVMSGGAAWWAAGDAVQATAPAAAVSAPVAGRPAATSYADAVARVAPAVVTVRVEKKASVSPTGLSDDPLFRRFFGDRLPMPDRAPRQRGLGSGVIVEADGHVVTNAHVVDGADRVRVVLTDGREFDATVVGADPPTDLAVLKVDAANLPALPLGDSDAPRVGDVVLAIGNPLGVGQTVTMGILSAKGRATGAGDGSYEDFLQTDAPINQGNSGGALVTATGELIGINSQILTPSGGNIGIGFAIPTAMVRHVLQEIVDNGEVRRSRLGVTIQPVTADIAESLQLDDVRGALVNGVDAGGPADRAGLQTGDVITRFNGEVLSGGNELRNMVAASVPGSKATVTVVRDGRARDLVVELERLEPRLAGGRAPGGDAGAGVGLSVQPLTPQLADRLQLPRSTAGLVITGVDPEGRAAEAGLREGDVIRAVDGQPATSASQLRSLLDQTPDRPALVLVQRGENSFFATVG